MIFVHYYTIRKMHYWWLVYVCISTETPGIGRRLLFLLCSLSPLIVNLLLNDCLLIIVFGSPSSCILTDSKWRGSSDWCICYCQRNLQMPIVCRVECTCLHMQWNPGRGDDDNIGRSVWLLNYWFQAVSSLQA